MPTLNSHTHCQAAQASRTNLSLSKSVSEPTRDRKRKSTKAQHCINVMRAKQLNMSSYAPKKLYGWWTVKCFEIPQYAYT